MKIAVFLYGEYRQFELAVNIYKDKLSSYNPDYYVSSWDYSREKCELGTYDEEHIVTEDKIKKYLPNAVISLRKDKGRDRFTTKIYEHIHVCADMCRDSGKDYDVIIVKRIDEFEIFEDSLLSDIDINSLYTDSGLSDGITFDFCDLFFYGGYKPVLQFIDEFYAKILENPKIFVHSTPDKFLYHSDISVKKFPEKVILCLIRPHMVDLFKNCKSYSGVADIRKGWGQLIGEWYDVLKYSKSKV